MLKAETRALRFVDIVAEDGSLVGSFYVAADIDVNSVTELFNEVFEKSKKKALDQILYGDEGGAS